MAINPLRAAVREAHRVDRELARLFALYLGSVAHPRGRVMTAYRQARAAVAAAYQLGGVQRQVMALEALRVLRDSLAGIGRDAMTEAARLGVNSAMAQVAAYKAVGESIVAAGKYPPVEVLTAGLTATVNAQVSAAEAMVRANAEKELLLGGADRLGLLQPSPVLRDGSRWLAMASSAGFTSWLGGDAPAETSLPDLGFKRQAIAAIDGRTTDCCLRVHGQIVGMDEPYVLTGEPRYADRIMAPGFHWNCRTSEAVYQERYEDGSTEEMKQWARDERQRRAEIEKRILEKKAELIGREADPTARKRKDDDKETRKLRRELKALKRKRVQG